MADAEHRLVAQTRSRTAVLGYLAAAAARQQLDRRSVLAWFRRNGLTIGDGGLRDALKLRLTRQGDQPPKDVDPIERDWIRDSLDFDTTKLDLDLALVIFPAAERAVDLPEILRSTQRVVRLYQGYDRDLVAVIVYDGARERQRLQALLEEHEPHLRWMVVREVDDTPRSNTWLGLAQQIAAEERLLDR